MFNVDVHISVKKYLGGVVSCVEVYRKVINISGLWYLDYFGNVAFHMYLRTYSTTFCNHKQGKLELNTSLKLTTR